MRYDTIRIVWSLVIGFYHVALCTCLNTRLAGMYIAVLYLKHANTKQVCSLGVVVGCKRFGS